MATNSKEVDMKGLKGYTAAQKAIIVLSILLMFGTRFMPSPEGLSQGGFQVLGILIGGLILWLSISVDWTSLFVIFALMTVPGYNAKIVASGSLGNDTVFFLILTFMLSACLAKTGVAKRIAILFMTSKLSRKSPWLTVGMIFISVFILSSGLSSTATIMIFIPILYEIYVELGYTKEDEADFPAMMMMGTVVVAQIAQATTPISHAMTLVGMSTYESYVGEPIEFFTYVAINIPLGIIMVLLWYLICRYMWRPDVSRLSKLDFDRIQSTIGPVTKHEKVASVIYIITISLWVLPGLTKYIMPSVAPFFEVINQCYPPMVSIILLNLIRIDGEKVLDYKDAVKAVPWNTVIFMGAILMLGSALSNKDFGISTYIASVFGEIFKEINPMLFTMIVIALAIIITQFISNAVTIAICMAIGMPLALNVFGNSVNALLMGILITSGASYAYSTPPATPPVAVAADSGWVGTDKLFKWGMITTLVTIIVFYVIGIPLAKIFC